MGPAGGADVGGGGRGDAEASPWSVGLFLSTHALSCDDERKVTARHGVRQEGPDLVTGRRETHSGMKREAEVSARDRSAASSTEEDDIVDRTR